MGTRRNNGEGTFYYSKTTGLWVGQFYDANGKRMSVTSKDKKTCLKKLKDKIKSIDDGTYVETCKDTMGQLAERYLEHQYKTNTIGANTYVTKKMYVDNIKKSAIGNIPVQKITSYELQEYFDTLVNYSNSYIKKIHMLVNNVLEEALKNEVILKNPIAKTTRPKSSKAQRVVMAFTMDEQIKFENYIQNEEYKNVFLLAIKTGMRCGEILALTIEDIDFKNKYIRIANTVTRDVNSQPTLGDDTKTGKIRTFPINTEIENILKDTINNMTLNPNHLLFCLPNGSVIRPSTMNSVFKRICKDLSFNKEYSFHVLRHTFATRCIEAGISMPVVQKLLGHADIETTIDVYTTIFDRYTNNEFDKLTTYMNANR